MRSKWAAGIAGMLLLATAGCTERDMTPEEIEAYRVRPMQSWPGGSEGDLAPVMRDVYDRSIPAEVYSAE
ncbi:hypothetical protein [Paenibacillus tengchongensis]|uniref:hypothetical protein n=1 Tax=Paenibacillus tengchongensis TaxID=2608684 RepID=UPI00124F5305|nr:hypothetical protein [Paenibacillus tengchongensis]